jgi:hypothetical protein
MRSKVPTISLLSLLLCSVALRAQSNGGSSYSVLNIGDIRGGVTAAGAGRGGIETSSLDYSSINSLNPALWGDLHAVTVQAGLSFQQFQVSDAASTIAQNNTRVENFSAAFPWSEPLGGTVALVIRPYSSVNYSTQVERTVSLADSSSTRSTVNYSGTGGISQVLLGTSIRPIPEITIGVAGGRYLGMIERETDVSFPDAALNPAVYLSSDLYTGWGVRLGAMVQPIPELRIGMTAEPGAELSRERTRVSAYLDAGREVADTLPSETSTFSLPPRFSAGVSYRTGRFLVSTEAQLQDWSSSGLPDARSSSRIAIGTERLANESATSTGFEKWTFRLGGYYDQSYYNVGAGGINQLGVTLGLGIPLTSVSGLNVGTGLDIATELGMRGSTENGMTKEMFAKIHIQFSVSELWFQRRGN